MRTGQTVWVLNNTMSGTVIIEGQARILRRIPGETGHYIVRFDNGDEVERYIDPKAQANPARYVADLNAGYEARTT